MERAREIIRLQERLRILYRDREREAWELRKEGLRWDEIGLRIGTSRIMAMRCAGRYEQRAANGEIISAAV